MDCELEFVPIFYHAVHRDPKPECVWFHFWLFMDEPRMHWQWVWDITDMHRFSQPAKQLPFSAVFLQQCHRHLLNWVWNIAMQPVPQQPKFVPCSGLLVQHSDWHLQHQQQPVLKYF
jgi:hypothetical protein